MKNTGFEEGSELITQSIRDILKANVTTLRQLLKDDAAFFYQLIDQVVCPGDGADLNAMKRIIHNKYQEETILDANTNHTERNMYIYLINNLENAIYNIMVTFRGDETVDEKVSHAPEEEQDVMYLVLRDEIKDEIYNLSSIETGEITLTGEF